MPFMWRLTLIVAVAILCAAPARSQTVSPGTYRFRLCEAVCSTDSMTVIARGVLVLFPDSVGISDSVRISGTEASRAAARHLLRGVTAPNACFRVDARRESVRGRELYLGIISNGLSRWGVRNDSISVLMYASPDAFFRLIGTPSDSASIRGIGMQLHCCGDGWAPFGVLIAERTGPPRVGDCAPE